MWGYQGHFFSTIYSPLSWYSCFPIQRDWKEPREARMDPPIQEENFLSVEAGYAIILIFEFGGDISLSFVCNRELNPDNKELPPVKMMLLKSCLLISMSHELIDSSTMWCIPLNLKRSELISFSCSFCWNSKMVMKKC